MTLNSVTDSEHLREVDPDGDDGLHLHLALDPGVAADRCPVVDVEADVVPHSDPVPGVAAEPRLGVDPEVDVVPHSDPDPGVTAEHRLGVDPEVDVGPHSDPVPGVAAEHRLGADPEVDVGPLSDPGHGMVAEHRPGVDPEVDVGLHPARIPDAAAADDDHRARTRDAACRSSAVSGGTRDWRGSDHPNSFQY